MCFTVSLQRSTEPLKNESWGVRAAEEEEKPAFSSGMLAQENPGELTVSGSCGIKSRP